MRSSTNIYLTALAIADITFLFFSFVLTFQHYPNIHHPKYILYWSFYGLTVWFRDAAGKFTTQLPSFSAVLIKKQIFFEPFQPTYQSI